MSTTLSKRTLLISGLTILFGCSGGGGGGTSPAPTPTPDFSLAVTPPTSIHAGSIGNATVSVSRTNGHTAGLTLSLAANAQGLTGTGSIAASGTGGTLAITVPVSLTPGTYTLTANATDGTLTRTAGFTLTTAPPNTSPDFSITVTPPASLPAGTSGNAGIAVNRFNGHTASLTLGLQTNAQGITGTGWIAAPGTSGTMNLTVPMATAPGSYALTATATDGTLNRTSNFSLTVATGGTATFPAASVVIGQPNFLAKTAYQGGSIGPNTIGYLVGNPLLHNNVLYFPDRGANRVLGFPGVPTANNASATFVLGQEFLDTAYSGNSATRMDSPHTVKVSGSKLLVTDYDNHRVLIWNTIPTTTNAPADVVVGQPGFGTSDPATSRTGFKYPDSIEAAGGKLIVTDSSNNRVLIWNTIPTSHGAPADLVLGQADFTHGTENDDNQDGTADPKPTARTFWVPQGVWSDGTRLVVCDMMNNRVLIWTTFPTANFQPANLVIGQSDFTHNVANDDDQSGNGGLTPTARTVANPVAVTSDGTRIYLADTGSNRVLVYDFPTANFPNATKVIGQSTFTQRAPNDDNQDGVEDAIPSARTLSSPQGIALAGSKLLVMESLNHRCLVFDIP